MHLAIHDRHDIHAVCGTRDARRHTADKKKVTCQKCLRWLARPRVDPELSRVSLVYFDEASHFGPEQWESAAKVIDIHRNKKAGLPRP